MIGQVANAPGCMPKLHAGSTRHKLDQHNLSNRKEVLRDFICRSKTTVPVPHTGRRTCCVKVPLSWIVGLQSACSLANQELRGEYLVVGLPILSSMISTARATPRSARIICPSSSARRRTPPSVTALWIARPSVSAVSLL
jgi:hypothetical protein